MSKIFVFLTFFMILSLLHEGTCELSESLIWDTVPRKALQACEKIKNLDIVEVPGTISYLLVGKYISPGDFPHHVSIGHSPRNNSIVNHKCSGTLISKDFIMTAASCAHGTESKPKIIRLGSIYHKKGVAEDEEEDNGAVEIVVKNIILHPNFTTSSFYDDIALIELDSPISQYTNVIKPACLAAPTMDLNETFIISGWGLTLTENRKLGDQLKQGKAKKISLNKCGNFYSKQRKLVDGLRETQMCALGTKTPYGQVIDVCSGDGGAPLEYELLSEKIGPIGERNSYSIVVGVHSFGIGNQCGGTIPGVYTRVSQYLDWIESVVWPNDVEI